MDPDPFGFVAFASINCATAYFTRLATPIGFEPTIFTLTG
jgi:hypothetical protein